MREGGEKNVLGIKCYRRSVRGAVSEREGTKRGDSVPCWLTRAPGISPRPGLGLPNRTDTQRSPIHARNPPRTPPRVHSKPNNRQACPALIPRFSPSNKARKPHLESQPHRRLLHPTSRLLLVWFSVLVVTQATLRGCNGFGRPAPSHRPRANLRREAASRSNRGCQYGLSPSHRFRMAPARRSVAETRVRWQSRLPTRSGKVVVRHICMSSTTLRLIHQRLTNVGRRDLPQRSRGRGCAYLYCRVRCGVCQRPF